MYCKYCGTKLPDEARFCAGCGKPVEPAGQSGEEKGKREDKVKSEKKWRGVGPLILLLCVFPLWSLFQNVLWRYVYNIDRFNKGIDMEKLLPPYLAGRFEIFGFFLFPNWVIWFLGIVLTLFLVKLGRIRLTQEDGSRSFSYADALALSLFFCVLPVSCAFFSYGLWQTESLDVYREFLAALEYTETMLVSPQLIFWGLLIFFMLYRSGRRKSGWKGVLAAGILFVVFSAIVYLAAGLLVPHMYFADGRESAKELLALSIEQAREIAMFLWLRLFVLSGFAGMYGRRYLKAGGGILLSVLMLAAVFLGDLVLMFWFRLPAFIFPVPWIIGGFGLVIIRLRAWLKQRAGANAGRSTI